jgi:hypothetical protein
MQHDLFLSNLVLVRIQFSIDLHVLIMAAARTYVQPDGPVENNEHVHNRKEPLFILSLQPIPRFHVSSK